MAPGVADPPRACQLFIRVHPTFIRGLPSCPGDLPSELNNMDPAKLTEKSRVAVQAAQQLAVARGHQPPDAEHLALALVQQPEGLVPRLLEKMHRPPATVGKVIDDLLARKPSVGGPGSNPAAAGISQALSQTLEKALTAATAMGDDYVSVEHLVLGLLGLPRAATPSERPSTTWASTRAAGSKP